MRQDMPGAPSITAEGSGSGNLSDGVVRAVHAAVRAVCLQVPQKQEVHTLEKLSYEGGVVPDNFLYVFKPLRGAGRSLTLR